MATPALNIPIRADLTKFREDMRSTSSLATTAVKSITKNVVEMNAGWLAAQGAVGGTALAFGRVLGVLGPIALGVTVVRDAFRLMAYATELAKVRIEEYSEVASRANKADLSTEMFQRVTKSGAAARVSIDEVTDALKRFADVSVDKLGGSDLQQRLDMLTKAGNFQGNSGLAALSGANSTEDKLRAIVKLIDEAMSKGERLAALDLAGKAFGEPLANALRADAGYLDDMLKRADAMSKTAIISQEDVGRAIELKNRMEAAEKVLSEKWKPIQDDLAAAGTNYHANWVGITETLAQAVGYATALYQALKQVPDWFTNNVGNASIWSTLTAATGKLGLNSELPGLQVDLQQLAANDKLRAALQDYANVTRSMRDASGISAAIRGDQSKAPSAPAPEANQNNQFDRASESIAKHTARLRADAEAAGSGAAAQERLRAEATLTAAAQQAGLPMTEAMTAKIKELAAGAGAAAEALAKARVASDIKFGQQTAFLSVEDTAIAQQLASIYGNDVPRALASSEAAAMRLNNALREANLFGQQTFENLFTSFGQNIRNGMSAWDAFRNAGVNALGSIADELSRMAARKLWQSALGGLGSLFGFSSGGYVGQTGSINIGDYVMPKFDSGGYTGSGGKYEPAGIVHRGEYVFDAASTQRLGVANLERLRGYASGGFVSAPAAPPSVAGQGTEQRLHITVSSEVDDNGNLKSYVKRVSQQATAAGISGFVQSPSFVDHVAGATKSAQIQQLV